MLLFFLFTNGSLQHAVITQVSFAVAIAFERGRGAVYFSMSPTKEFYQNALIQVFELYAFHLF